MVTLPVAEDGTDKVPSEANTESVLCQEPLTNMNVINLTSVSAWIISHSNRIVLPKRSFTALPV